jgi:hypothetical protein
MISAHALSLPARLVTNNTREFAKVPGLQLENWVPDSQSRTSERTIAGLGFPDRTHR